MDELSDIALLERLQQADASAYTEIFHRYWEKLYAIAYNRLRVRTAAEDVVQEVLASLWARREVLEIRHLSGYLATATRYAVFRQISRLLPDQPLDNPEVMQQVAAPDMDHLDYYRLQERLGAEIARLPEKCRLVFLYSRKEQYSNKEIAAAMQLSEKTVEAHLTKALKQLRVRLKDVYPYLSFFF
ncbi:MAG: sigma-70 family RNA polymerase sigma factor [Chitinophaga sp.]|uniref:sigma-70 family RNA polymerase sigma factor n=1 Tax=Chitinophaga sp. TaxID=1869181 RepID=UPI001B09F062|nr:sigma-70 family RNA polymerase sigma factor [Chitinophaga sp.]MBO9727446.1 sigma-70 family RNA polymerase sigma factor [Chitinophaga sp.]